jgi:tetratricopeptide (TPR) repeat protein/energy-coupling factor transporter ATP-binding protein EcfA2
MGVESSPNPYPGLRPFEFPERHLFFGREGQSEELSRRLRQSRFLAVVGTSGSGKSSLVRAGLLPALYGGFMGEAGPRWRVSVLRPGNDPIRNLAASLHRPALFRSRQEPPPKNLLEEALIESDLRISSLGLSEYPRKAGLPPDENLLVVADQFEELFRFRKESQRADADDEAAAFVKLLLEAARAEAGRVYVVITMRSDFLGDCAQFRDLPEAINDGQYLIPRMTREQLRQAIVAPARVYGAQLTTRLVNRLLNDIGDDQDQLPILQHALMRTWDEWERAGRPAEGLDFAHYEAIGGMAEALSKHADEAYAELGDDGRKKIAERLFKCLTETDRDNREIRRRATVREVCAITKAGREEVVPVVNTFRRAGRTFIMPPPEVDLDEDSLLDISHESLIRNWKKLDAWVKEEARSAQQYRRLADAAELHEVGELGYWRDPQLSFALKWREKEQPTPEWASRYHPAFARAMRFLDESEAEREQEQERERKRQETELEREREHAKRLAKSARRLRLAVVALAFILLLASGLAVYALVQKRQADANAREAQANAQKAVLSEQALSMTYKALATERDNLAAAQNELRDANKELVGRTEQLETQEKELQKALKTATDERKRAEASEAETASALAKQKELTAAANAATAEARAATARAEATVKREEKNRSGLVFFEKGEPNKAEAQFASLLEDYTADKELAEDKRVDGRWWALHNLGAIHARLGGYDRAARKYWEAIEILGDAPGESRKNLIATYRRLGQLYAESGNYLYGAGELGMTGNRMAYVTYVKLMRLLEAEETIRKEDPRYEADVKREYADVLYALRQDEGAGVQDTPMKPYREALEVYKTYRREQNTSKIIAILNKLADIAMQENPADAEKFIREALKVREDEAKLEPTHPDIAESYADLARVYQETGQREKATTYGNLADRIRAWTFRVNKQKSFPHDKLTELAHSYIEIGRCDNAEKVYLETLKMMEESHERGYIKEDSPEWLQALLRTARLYNRYLHEDERAARYYAEYVDMSIRAESLSEVLLAGLQSAAQFFRAKGDYARAQIAYDRVYKTHKVSLRAGREGPWTLMDAVVTLSGLGRTLEATGKDAEAEALYQEAVELSRPSVGRDPSYGVVATMGLANLYLRQGKYPEAEEHFKKAIALVDAAVKAPDVGPTSAAGVFLSNLPEYVTALMGLGKIEERKSQGAAGSPAAAQYFERALSLLDEAKSSTVKNVFNQYFVSGKATTRFNSDRADVLEALAKHVEGERAAGLRKQAEETRQSIKAAREKQEAEAKEQACPGMSGQ